MRFFHSLRLNRFKNPVKYEEVSRATAQERHA